MRLKPILIGAAAVAAGLVVTAIAIVSTTDVNQYRSLIADRVKAATGRDFAIQGDLQLELGLVPAVAAADVTLANAAWGSRPEMVAVKRFEAEVELLPLIFGDIKVRRLVMIEPDILLETDARGRGNWQFETAAPAPSAPGRLPQVGEVTIRGAKLVYRDGRTRETTSLTLARATLRAEGVADPLKIDIDGAFNERRFRAAGVLGSVEALARPAPVAVDIKIEAAGATLKIAGQIRDPLALAGYDLDISAAGGEAGRAAEFVGIKLAALGPFKADSKLIDRDGTPSLARLKAELGRPDLVRIRAEGAIADPLARTGIALSATIEGREIGALSGLAVPGWPKPLPPVPALGAYRLSVKLADGPGGPAILELALEVGSAELVKVEIEGSVRDPLRQKGFDLDLALESRDLAAAASRAGFDLPVAGPLKLNARLADAGADRYEAKGIRMALGASDFSGEAALSLAGARPSLSARLASNRLDLASQAGAPAKRSAPPAGEGRVFGDEKLPFELLDLADADLRYQAKEVLAMGMRIRNLSLAASLRDGELALRPLAAELGGGKLAAELGANRRGQTLAAQLDAKGIDLGSVLKESGASDLIRGGPSDVSLDLSGAGGSLRALMAALDGHAVWSVGEGEIESRYVDLLGADAVAVLTPLQGGHAQTKLNCAVGRIDVRDGLANLRALVVDTGQMTVSGEGTVNLAKEEFHLLVRPRPKEATLVSLAVPIRVRGTLANPQFLPDPGAVALGVVGAIAGTGLLGPLGLLVPLMSTGQRGGNPCVAALAQPAAAPPAPTQRPPAQPQTRRPSEQPGAGRPLEELGRGLRQLFGR
ncbi:MAG: AsmA family protein [Pseudomonadota bacterium]